MAAEPSALRNPGAYGDGASTVARFEQGYARQIQKEDCHPRSQPLDSTPLPSCDGCSLAHPLLQLDVMGSLGLQPCERYAEKDGHRYDPHADHLHHHLGPNLRLIQHLILYREPLIAAAPRIEG